MNWRILPVELLEGVKTQAVTGLTNIKIPPHKKLLLNVFI